MLSDAYPSQNSPTDSSDEAFFEASGAAEARVVDEDADLEIAHRLEKAQRQEPAVTASLTICLFWTLISACPTTAARS